MAWVFRTMETGENPQKTRLRGMLYELASKHAEIGKAVGTSRERVAEFAEAVDSQFDSDTVTAELKAQMLPYREKFDDGLHAVTEKFEHLDLQLGALNSLLEEFRIVGVGLAPDSAPAGFAGFASFDDFLIEIRKTWDGIVTSEHEALIRAVKYYREAYIEGRDIAPGNQQIQASYLIAELSRRVGDFDAAREYFNSTIKHGQDFIYRNRQDNSRTALARKILELAIEQGKTNMEALQTA